jgi:DNA-binding NtrC family response regulator
MGERILIVDDEASIIVAVTGLLRQRSYQVASAETGAAALEVVRSEPIGLTLLDLRLGAEDGLALLPQLKTLRPEMSVIILTGQGTIENAFEALRRGADYFVEKPIRPPSFLTIIEKGLEAYRLRRKNLQLERLTAQAQPIVFREGSAISEALRLAETVAARDTTVLLRGETGTGKELLARLIHDASPRKKEPFVEVNCAGLQRDLLESELFGHERGAFTGAVERKIGLFEAADGGTLFLDEIAGMDMTVQAKLLKVLEQKRFRRLGGVAEVVVDVRLIAATNRDLAEEVAEGRFRQDLLYRLNVFAIDLPPLRERREDILPLAEHFLREFCGAQAPTIASAAADMLLAYAWPGNVRELKNVIERAAILCPPGSEVQPVHLQQLSPSKLSDLNPSLVSDPSFTPMTLEEVEREHVKAVLELCNWSVSAAAPMLGISRETLYQKIKKYNLSLAHEIHEEHEKKK